MVTTTKKRTGFIRKNPEGFLKERVNRLKKIQSQVNKLEQMETSVLYPFAVNYLNEQIVSVPEGEHFELLKESLDKLISIETEKLDRRSDWTTEEFMFVQLYVLIATKILSTPVGKSKLEAATLIGRSDAALGFAYNNNKLNKEIKQLTIEDYKKEYRKNIHTKAWNEGNGLEEETESNKVTKNVPQDTYEGEGFSIREVEKKEEKHHEQSNILATLKTMALASRELDLDLNRFLGDLAAIMNKAVGGASYEMIEKEKEEFKQQLEKEKEGLILLHEREKEELRKQSEKEKEEKEILQKTIDIIQVNATRFKELKGDEQLIYIEDFVDAVISNTDEPIIPANTGLKIKLTRNGIVEVSK